MPKFTVHATLTKKYEIEVVATDESQAIAALDEWIADDFDDFEVSVGWEFQV
jgi:phosphotransferase system HPr-like phosphotransfer protein